MSEPLEERKVQDIPDTRMADAIKLRDAMAVLIASDGWKMLASFHSNQSTKRQVLLLQPLKSADEVYEQEFKKGEAAAHRVASLLPETLRKSAEQTIAALMQREEEEPPQREDPIGEREKDV